jgi:uncharacterized protein (UPF0297 family)
MPTIKINDNYVSFNIIFRCKCIMETSINYNSISNMCEYVFAKDNTFSNSVKTKRNQFSNMDIIHLFNAFMKYYHGENDEYIKMYSRIKIHCKCENKTIFTIDNIDSLSINKPMDDELLLPTAMDSTSIYEIINIEVFTLIAQIIKVLVESLNTICKSYK